MVSDNRSGTHCAAYVHPYISFGSVVAVGYLDLSFVLLKRQREHLRTIEERQCIRDHWDTHECVPVGSEFAYHILQPGPIS
jgi:hypothetical protein